MDIVPQNIINISRNYFEQNEKVVMAFLFGSYASGNFCKESDIDIGVLLKNEDENAEIEIQNRIEKLIGHEVDTVFMSRSPATLSWSIIRKGIPIIIKDRNVFLNFMLDVSTEAQDFLEFNLDTWRKKNDTRTSR
jgi:predicted nucleotidyltransferase